MKRDDEDDLEAFGLGDDEGAGDSDNFSIDFQQTGTFTGALFGKAVQGPPPPPPAPPLGDALGKGIKWDTAAQGIDISLKVPAPATVLPPPAPGNYLTPQQLAAYAQEGPEGDDAEAQL